MAIKAVDNIPSKGRPKTIVGQIREDIKEAFEKGIDRYELVGDIYKGRQVYAPTKTEAGRFYSECIRAKVRPQLIDLGSSYISHYAAAEGCYKVYSSKDEDGEIHVYVELFRDALEERAESLVEELNAKYKAKKAKMEMSRDVRSAIDDYMEGGNK